MTIDNIRAVLEKRAEHYTRKANDVTAHDRSVAHSNGKAIAYREALEVLELLDGESGPCPACGGRMGSRLPDGRWRCAGLSSYAVLASECCGHVYQD